MQYWLQSFFSFQFPAWLQFKTGLEDLVITPWYCGLLKSVLWPNTSDFITQDSYRDTSPIILMVDAMSYFSFQPVLHDWCNKGCDIYCLVCGMGAKKKKIPCCKWERTAHEAAAAEVAVPGLLMVLYYFPLLAHWILGHLSCSRGYEFFLMNVLICIIDFTAFPTAKHYSRM